MDRRRKNLLATTWERCRFVKTMTWDGGARRRRKCQVAPDGCFSVLVGTEKRRFVVKTEHVNHPMFMMLLEDAESEYGFCTEGPIVLPCDPGLFERVLSEMEVGDDNDGVGGPGCGVGCSPARLRSGSSGSGSYSVLNMRSRMIKMNR